MRDCYHLAVCGRYSVTNLLSLRRFAPAIDWDALDLAPNNNCSPTQMLPIVIPATSGGRRLVLAQWGFIPPWSDTRRPRFSTHNAKTESLAESKLWSAALTKPVAGERGRCLVLAEAFYEWQQLGSRKQPHLISLPDRQPFAFAGLYGKWHDRQSGEDVFSFTIITCPANAYLQDIHQRMPVILDEADEERWLHSSDWEDCLALCRPCADDHLIALPVARVPAL